MVKVLISLVGGRPLPNVLLALHLKPDYLYLVASKDSLGVGRDCEKTITALPEKLRSEPLSVNPYVLQDTIDRCREIILKHTNDEIVINVTLGPKTMAFGAYDVAKEARATRQQIDICYLAREGLVWVLRNQIDPVRIGINDYFASYAWSITFRTDAPDKLVNLVTLLADQLPLSHRLLHILRSNGRGKGKRTRHCKQALSNDEYELLQNIETLRLVTNVNKDSARTSWTINSDDDARLLLTGDWLEFHVYQVARASTDDKGRPLFDECGWGVEDRAGKGEIDFVGIFGGQMIIASCKTEDSIKRVWFEELHSKVEQLGRGMCSTLLISTVPRSSRTAKDLQEYDKWASERRIVLIMAEDLPKLSNIFNKIVLADEEAEPKNFPCYARI